MEKSESFLAFTGSRSWSTFCEVEKSWTLFSVKVVERFLLYIFEVLFSLFSFKLVQRDCKHISIMPTVNVAVAREYSFGLEGRESDDKMWEPFLL